MPSLNSRVLNLEQLPQTQRPHAMTHQELDLHMQSMDSRAVQAFVKTMTDDDLNSRIEYLNSIKDEHHANT